MAMNNYQEVNGPQPSQLPLHHQMNPMQMHQQMYQPLHQQMNQHIPMHNQMNPQPPQQYPFLHPVHMPMRMPPMNNYVPPQHQPNAAPMFRGQPAAFGQPPFGQQHFGQPPFGQPPFGQPPFGQPALGQPALGQPGAARPNPNGIQRAAPPAQMANIGDSEWWTCETCSCLNHGSYCSGCGRPEFAEGGDLKTDDVDDGPGGVGGGNAIPPLGTSFIGNQPVSAVQQSGDGHNAAAPSVHPQLDENGNTPSVGSYTDASTSEYASDSGLVTMLPDIPAPSSTAHRVR